MAREKGLARTESQGIQNVEPWNTFTDMERMMRNFFLSPWPGFRAIDRMFEGMTGQFNPQVDLSETENEFVLSATIPGLEKDDINIDVTGDSITISGERKAETDRTGKRYHVRQQSYGTFQVSYGLPSDIKPDDVQASYKNGILEVKLPKAEVAKAHKVEVKTEG